MSAYEPVYVIGDIHGQLEKLRGLLRGAGLVGEALEWTGGAVTLWLMGDFFDRGPDGIGAVDLVMRLQEEAAAAGGRVASLLGNHEVMLLGAQRFGGLPPEARDYELKLIWEDAGGNENDLAGLTPGHVEWLTALPAMAREGGYLLMHANSVFYLDYGSSLEEVNASIRAVLQGDDADAWIQLIEGFRTRRFFDDSRPDGKTNAQVFLRRFGGQRIVHGHVPIYAMASQSAREITGPLIYADGLCVNVDGGMAGGGPGFVYALPRLDAS